MSAQHTKGPWRVGSDERSVFARVETSAGTTHVATASGPARLNDADCRANANLIAAAPELLAALEETLRALEMHLSDDANAHGLKHVDILCPCSQNEVIRARAAIAKAKGEAST